MELSQLDTVTEKFKSLGILDKIKRNINDNITNGDLAIILNNIMKYRIVVHLPHHFSNKISALNLEPEKILTKLEVLKTISSITYIDIPSSIDTFPISLEDTLLLLEENIAHIINTDGENFSKDVDGNLIISASNTTISNMEIVGNLIIAEGALDDEIALKNVNISGDIILKAGGRNDLILENVIFNNLIIGKISHNININTNKTASITHIKIATDIFINYSDKTNIKITATANEGYDIEKLEMNDENSCLKVSTKIKGIAGFSTGHTAYHLSNIKLNNGENGVVSGNYDGYVVALSSTGEKIWENKTGDGFPNSINTADIDGDGFDETFISSADGKLYVFGSNGELLWTFESPAPIFASCVVTESDGKKYVLTGGIDCVLYKLDTNGKILQTRDIKGPAGPLKPTPNMPASENQIVRHLKTTKIYGTDKEYVFMCTAVHGSAVNTFILIDSENMGENLWFTNFGGAKNNNRYLGRITIADINNDGQKEIIVAHASAPKRGSVDLFTSKGEFMFTSERDYWLENRAYSQGAACFIDNIDGETPYILNQIANQIATYSVTGELIAFYTSKAAYSDAVYDRETGLLYLGSDISGGDEITVIDMKNSNWGNNFEAIEPIGRMEEIVTNLIEVNKQIDRFQKPNYQTCKNGKVNMIVDTCDLKIYQNEQDYEKKWAPNGRIDFAHFEIISEKFDRFATLPEKWAKKKDKRKAYDKTADEIVEFARNLEKKHEDFAIWAGHGTDPFLIQPSTLERVLEVAPNHCKLLIYAEFAHIDDFIINYLFKPLAEACRKHGTCKLFFRNKNLFWAAQAHSDTWFQLINGDYADVIIPTMEETNSRAQEVSLAARIGLWMSKATDNWGGRLIEDNANFHRQFEWGAQKIQTHYIRTLVHQIANGAKYFHNGMGIHMDQNKIVYKLLDKSALITGERDRILSVSDLAIGMREPDMDFDDSSNNGHSISIFDKNDTTAFVFDRTTGYWGGSPLLDHDFGKYGLGAKNRMTNFLTANPHGIIPIISDKTDIENSCFKTKISTDGKYFYDENNNKFTPIEYKSTMENLLKEATGRLPIVVEGNSAWTAHKISDNHIRVVLVDSGYLSPCEQPITIKVQNNTAKECTDILSGEKLEIVDNKINATVPAGIFKIVDITI